MRGLIRFFKKDDGATAIEYGLIAALIAVAVIGAVSSTGTTTRLMYENIGNEVNKVMTK